MFNVEPFVIDANLEGVSGQPKSVCSCVVSVLPDRVSHNVFIDEF